MDGMDKRYDGHVWTKTQTTNINNDLGLVFRSSICVGHLECHNPHCNYLQRVHPTSLVNDTEFHGFTNEFFPVGGPVPTFSTLVCKICKEPPKCIVPCVAKIFYVHGKDTTQWACICLGNHRHPVKVGNCRDSHKRIDAFIEAHVERTPQATHNKIVLEASKVLVDEFILRNDSDPHHLLSLEELEPVFDRCNELNPPPPCEPQSPPPFNCVLVWVGDHVPHSKLNILICKYTCNSIEMGEVVCITPFY